MKIIVTGAKGYLGRNFLKYLSLNPANEVIGVDLTDDAEQNIVACDLRNFSETKDLLEQNHIDIIFNFAGTVKADSFEQYYEGNLIIANNILESIKEKQNIKCFLIGTAAQYGNQISKAFSEKEQTSPTTLYGLSKKLQEELGQYYLQRYSLHIVFLRLFNIFGEDQPENFVIPKMINRVIGVIESNQETIEDINLDFYRDFVYIEDFHKILEKLAAKAPMGEIINIGSGYPVRINDIIKHLCALSPRKIELRLKDSEYNPGDLVYAVAQIDKLKSIIGEFKFTDFFDNLDRLFFKELNRAKVLL